MQPAEQPAPQDKPFVHPGSLIAIAAVNREIAEMEAAKKAVDAGLQMRRPRGTSTVYSIRLSPDEVEALERRAAAHGLRPTVFARNLIRIGLSPANAGDLVIAVEHLAGALDELREVVRC